MTAATAIVTGANSGLGRALASALAADGLHLGLVCRDRERGAAALAGIKQETGNQHLHLFVADLADQDAVRQLADAIRARFARLDLLVNNAATAFPERRLTPQGIEAALAVNALAPFLLSRLLLAKRGATPARIVNIGTRMDTALDLDDLDWSRRNYGMMQGYGQSKLALLHLTFELARRLQGQEVTVNCIFPGVFNSNLGGTDGAQNALWKAAKVLVGWALPSPERAARQVLHVARSKPLSNVSGQYLGTSGRPIRAPAQARNPQINRQVWEIASRLTGLDPDLPA